MSVYRLNRRDVLAGNDAQLHYFEITGRGATDNNQATKETFNDWKDSPLDIEGFKVIPFGTNNDIPRQIQETVFPNPLAPRLQNRKTELLIEQGPFLYIQEDDGRKYYRKPVEDKRIQEWLNMISYEDLLIHNSIHYYYQNTVFTKILRERGLRISSTGSIAELKQVNGFNCRLAYKATDIRKQPTHVIVGDWFGADTTYEVYPIFDLQNPTKYPVSIHIAKLPSYGMGHYTLPEIYGSLEWISQSTAIPKIFKALTENSLNIKWHIQSPAKYWDKKRKEIQDNCKAQNPPIQYKEAMLSELQNSILDKLSTLLSGIENTGKFWHNEYVIELIGANAKEYGWKIEPIEQKTKEYVESQILISNKADFSTVASMGIHTALANVGADGKSDSGSEQLYALKNHQLTNTPLPEYYVCKAVNDCLRIKFNTNIRVGFYHINPEREQDITSSQRISNQLPNA